MALFASGRMTGLTVDLGESITEILPIYEGTVYITRTNFMFCLFCLLGYPIMWAARTLGIGGRDITENLMKLLTDRGFSFTTTAERELVRGKQFFSFHVLSVSYFSILSI